jgi:hypothetical protein
MIAPYRSEFAALGYREFSPGQTFFLIPGPRFPNFLSVRRCQGRAAADDVTRGEEGFCGCAFP